MVGLFACLYVCNMDVEGGSTRLAASYEAMTFYSTNNDILPLFMPFN